MAEETAPTMTLEHVNVPPMQTWNYLRANGTSLTVPVPKSTGAVLGRLPKLFNRLDCAIGKDAETWASNSSDESRYVEVPALTERDEPIVIDVSCDKGEAHDTGIIFREGSRGTEIGRAHV